MNGLIRPAIVVAVVFLLAVCIFGSHFACDSADLRELFRAERRGQELDQFLHAQHRHVESKKHVASEVIAQRCSLREALARWNELDNEWLQEVSCNWPGYSHGLGMMYRLVSSDADLCYQRFAWRVADLLRVRPEESAAVLQRLENEYQELRTSPRTPTTTPTEQTERSR